MPEANLSQHKEAADYPLIPEGEYMCTVDGIEETTAKSSGNDMWKITLGIFEGKYEGSKIFDHLVWTPKAMPRIVNFFRALGRDTKKDETVTYIPGMALDRKVRVAVHVEKGEYNGEATEQTKVDFSGYGHIDGGQIREGELPDKQDDEDDVPF